MKRFVTTLIAGATIASTTLVAFAVNKTANNTISVTPQERAKIEEVVHQYLLDKPEVIVEAIQGFQRKQYEQAEKTIKQTQAIAGKYATPLFHQNNDPSIGNPKGKVTIVEFFDYQCPHCVDMAPIIEGTIKTNPNVRIVFKEFPIRGPMSELAARAALAANKQGKYYEFSHALLTSNQPLSAEAIDKVAESIGLNVAQLKKDMDSSDIKTQLSDNMSLAQNLKLFGTPAFFVGPTEVKGNSNINYIPGQMDKTQLQAAIDKANQ